MSASAVLRSSRRAWRRLRRLLAGGRAPVLVYHPDYGTELAVAEHDHDRARKILAFLGDEGLVSPADVVRPEPATLEALRRVHTDVYLESLEDPARSLSILGFQASPARYDTYVDVHTTAVGGTLLAARRARAARALTIHLGGGFHHAFADHGHGFCVFNDVAVAVAAERARGFDRAVLVVDLDLHDGDGTRAIFADDPTVHTYSIHNHDLGDPTALASTSLALGESVDDRTYLEAIRATLPGVLADVAPRLVFYLAGTDPAADDRLGNWNITPEGVLERDRLVLSSIRDAGGAAVVVLLAGGYGQAAWRYSARFFSWVLTRGRVIEPPSSGEMTLARYRRIARHLRSDELVLTGETNFELTDEDVLGSLSGHRRSSRFLDTWSRRGVELALERYGLLDRLRFLGFDRPVVELDLLDPAVQTLRIFDDSLRTEPLVELQVRRDATTVARMEVLAVEWLLLQNPRAAFTPRRARLPGQNHPGLGLLRDVVALLVVLSEQLGLDAIVFSPSHYHLAVQSRKLLRFLDPRDQGRFLAVCDAVEALPLVEATHAVDQGRVVEAHSGRSVPWRPAPMVLAVSDRMRNRLEGEAYRTTVESTRRELDFRLVPAASSSS